MARYQNRRDDIDITKEELNQITEALKKEEFRKLFIDYVDEINDPENRALFEKEITQYEKERGIDVTFVHPKPGYVIKTSVDGDRKAFINICENENVGKPKSSKDHQDGSSGVQWSLPYIQAPPRDDLDKNRKLCVVFDVIFHPSTLALARKDQRLKGFVNDTALAAVENSYKVKLDRTNLKFPKMDFKGYKHPCILRKKSKEEKAGPSEELIEDIIPNPYYPYSEPVTEPTVHSPKFDKADEYTTPKYQIKHRKNLDFQEFRYAPDAKMNSCVANELLIEINLPLIRSTSDIEVLLSEKTLFLKSERPAKYKLELKLPYNIVESESSAKFDGAARKLIVTASVDRQKHCLTREDSGLDSDPSRGMSSSSDEDITKFNDASLFMVSENVDNLSDDKDDFLSLDSHEDMELEAEPFFNAECYYSLPQYHLYLNKNRLTIDLSVKNIEPSSIFHEISQCDFKLKFYSMGSGFVPVHYSVLLKLEKLCFDVNSVKIDTFDDSLKIGLSFTEENVSVGSVFIGRNAETLQELNILELSSAPYVPPLPECNSDNKGDIVLKLSKLHLYSRVEDDSDDCEDEEEVLPQCNQSNVDEVPNKADVSNTLPKKDKKIRRTHSESACALPIPIIRRRSILKDTRSLSESSANDYNGFSLSMESEDGCGCGSPCEHGHVKKQVRFSETISKKVYRINSSILGQRKKNQRKARNKKRSQERRNSESERSISESEVSEFEVSEVSDLSQSEVSDISETSESDDGSQPVVPETPSSKSHRRKGKKNHRKSANTAKINSYINEA